MPTLRSHTHLQATQSQAQTKACKRVCLPNNTTDSPTYDRRELTLHLKNVIPNSKSGGCGEKMC